MLNLKKYWRKVSNLFLKIFRSIFILLVGLYRTVGTTHLGGACRFSPSCSEYAVEALNIHSPFKASILIIKRILRCRPGVPGGFDPVPLKARTIEEKNS
jgi:putative membrane protein insertion efficiency factor